MGQDSRGGDNDRETIWGINRKDRPWFQAMTLAGGTTGSVVLTLLQLKYRSVAGTPDAVALNILLGIGASFVASGFIAWEILQAKELLMAIADLIREYSARRLEKARAEARARGRAEGRAEGYDIGYADAEKGKPRKPPTDELDASS